MLVRRPVKFVPVEKKSRRTYAFEIYSFGMKKNKTDGQAACRPRL